MSHMAPKLFFPVPYLPVGTWPYSIAALRRQQPLGSSSPDLGEKQENNLCGKSDAQN